MYSFLLYFFVFFFHIIGHFLKLFNYLATCLFITFSHQCKFVSMGTLSYLLVYP